MLNIKSFCLCILLVLFIACNSFSQTGTLSATFAIAGGQSSTISITKPLLKFDNANDYWFVNPHNGDRHLTLVPDRNYGYADAAFIDLDGQQNDFDLYYERDSSHISFSNKKYAFTMPEWENSGKAKPLHIHINTFTNAEISFSFSGAMRCQENKDGAAVNSCTVSGTAHFYREPKFLKSDVMPGCDCDPTIYVRVYDAENNIRTTSACEQAMSYKVFAAMQKALNPVFTNVGLQGKGKMSPGQINVSILPGHTDITRPLLQENFCSTDYRHNGLTKLFAEKANYNNEDGYGLRLIKMPTDEQLGSGNGMSAANEAYMKNYMAKAKQIDSLLKLYTAKKITLEEYQQKATALTAKATASTPKQNNDAFEQAKIETNLSIKILLNPNDRETLLLKMCDKNRTVVQHNIKGAAFEIYSPGKKDNDGTFLPNRKFIYFGKFTAPVQGKSGGGYDAEITSAAYPANGNKLSVYNIIVKLEGSQDMMDKAVQHIDFNALLELVSKQ